MSSTYLFCNWRQSPVLPFCESIILTLSNLKVDNCVLIFPGKFFDGYHGNISSINSALWFICLASSKYHLFRWNGNNEFIRPILFLWWYSSRFLGSRHSDSKWCWTVQRAHGSCRNRTKSLYDAADPRAWAEFDPETRSDRNQDQTRN